MAVDRSLIKLLLALFAIVLAVLWLFAVITAFALPGWAPPVSVLALALAVVIPPSPAS